MGGASVESYLQLSDAQSNAVVELVQASDPVATLCSGTWVAPGWLLTAAHCTGVDELAVAVKAASGSRMVVSAEAIERRDDGDVALVRVAKDAFEGAAAWEPIGIASGRSELAPGARVEIVGFGLDGDGEAGERRFRVEVIAELNDREVVLDGLGRGGACAGDSGGPLLIRDRDGRPAVVGVLTGGSATCLDKDRYTRVDGLAAWVAGLVDGPVGTNSVACGSIGEEGRCFFGAAVWCEAEVLSVEACELGRRCGWHAPSAGYRCLDPADDACDGVDSVGTCFGSLAQRCSAGSIEETACSACEVCRLSGNDGSPYCAPASD